MAIPATLLRREIRDTLRLSGPVVAAQLAQISMSFVDTVMVGRLGSEELAGVALGSSIFFFVLIFCMGVVMAVGPMVSQAYGAGEDEPIGRTVRQGLWLGLLLTIPSHLLLYNMAPVLDWLGQEAGTVARASAYLRSIAWGILPFLWFIALRNFVEGLGRPLPITVISLAGVVLNVGSNYVLMYGKLGFPALGIVGTGYASSIVFWFLFGALTWYVQRKPQFRRYEVFSRLGRPDVEYFRALFQIGWPIGISLGIESGLFTTTAIMMGLLGSEALAAHQIALQCAAFTFMVPLGIGIATSVRVGHAAGRADPAGVWRAGFVGVALAALFMACAAFVFWIFPEPIIALYLELDDPANREVVTLAITLLGIAAVFQLFDGVQAAAGGALRGLKDTRVPMVISFVGYWMVGLGTGYALGFVRGSGAPGLWWGLVLGLATAAVLLSWRFHRLAYHVEPAAPGAAAGAGAPGS